MPIVIRNGRVIDPASENDCTADVLIADGRIVGVAPNLAAPSGEVFDASGLIVAPGFIDMHVHLREPGFEHAENIESGARAAAAGGFTSVCAMPNTKPVNDCATVTSYIVERARRLAPVNVFPIGAITKGSAGEELAAIGAMKAAGAVAISDDGLPVMNARVMRRAMEFARSYALPIIQHCEDLNLSAGGDMHEGARSVRWGLRGIPAASEDVMVARDLVLAQLTGARYHVAHISTRNAVAMVDYARRHGLPVTCEATPHHFTLADEDMAAYDSDYKMKPPLRSVARPRRFSRGHCRRRRHRHRHRPRSAPGQRKNAGVRALPVRHHRSRNGAGSGARSAGPFRQNRRESPGGAVHHRTGIHFAPGPRHASARRAGRRHHFQHRTELDLRRQPVVFPQPQLAVPWEDISRRPGSHHRQWRVRLAAGIETHLAQAVELLCRWSYRDLFTL